jgi:hypothetical protein
MLHTKCEPSHFLFPFPLSNIIQIKKKSHHQGTKDTKKSLRAHLCFGITLVSLVPWWWIGLFFPASLPTFVPLKIRVSLYFKKPG